METMIQPKVTGYRQLSEAEVALMNEGKALEAAEWAAWIAKKTSAGVVCGSMLVV